ncbi:MAG: isoleucine--tRNA ligase [Patescibacteria group bacterium]
MFEKVDSRQSLPEVEEKVLKFWEKEKIFEKSVKKNEGKKKYVFFDGPPFANGLPHYGHILANALKDAVTRYWNMKGYYVPRTNGWDCHGLPVEYEVEKELKISGRKDIEEYGIDKFCEKCRESVFRYTGEWEKLLKRIGRWGDFGNSYATLETSYMESIWWVFKRIWDKGLVYSGYKSMHICPRCETPLSNFEVTQGYKDVTDPSLTIKFALEKEPNTYFLVWTTTPWCLPGQIALTVHPEIVYAKVKSEGDFFWCAEKRLDDILRDRPYEIVETKKGKELDGIPYTPLFPYCADKKRESKCAFTIVVDDYVTDEDGTGFVTTSPDFGEDDMRVCLKYGIPFTETVTIAGIYRDHVADFAGESVKPADDFKKTDRKILQKLRDEGKLLWDETAKHSYPHCWRCDTPLLNYATESLFIKVTDIKRDLLQNNEKIHWQPEHIKDGRFGKWLDGARDWAISRNRFWGCPIPLWECECGEQICIGSIEELKEKSVGGKLPMRKGEVDLHKPHIDDIKIKCSKCGKEASRISDVLDCWFESGSMPYAQLHYPFENKDEFENNFPAHFIAEGLDQTRGWFYTLHVLSTILFEEPAFHNVIVNGILLAANGEKLSKRKKNYPDPMELFSTKGVDSMRYFLYSSTAPLAEDVRFSEDHVDEVVKKFTLTLWNTYSFFVTYANIDKWKPAKDYDGFKPKHKLDQWVLSELNTLVEEVTKNMDDYNLTNATRPLADFLENLSNWYVRRSRRRFWKSESDEDKNEAYATLYNVLVTFSKLMAPFMPFVAEEVYKNLTTPLSGGSLTGNESVHLEDWPKSQKNMIKPLFNEEVRIIRQIVNLGHAVRAKAKVKVRQPLSKVQVGLPADISEELVVAQKDVILEELNVKDLEFVKDVSDVVERICSPNARILGPKYGQDVQKIIQTAKSGDFEVLEGGKVKVGKYVLEGDEVEVGYNGKEGYDVESEAGMVVVLDTMITDELKNEGVAREVVRFIQDMRKEADYNVDDRIYMVVDAGELSGAVTKFADYIKKETLATELQQSGSMDSDKEKEVEINGQVVKLAVRIAHNN